MNNVPKLRFKGFSDEWEDHELQEIVDISNSKYDSAKSKINYKCIELEHIAQNDGRILGFINSKEQNSIKNKFNKGEVLFGKLRPYLKKYWFAEFEGVCSSEIWVLNGKGIINEFVFYIVQSSKFNIIANISSGSKMPRADWNYMRVVPFSIPSLQEQERIANFLTKVDKLIEKQGEKVKNLEAYKKGMMQKIFSQEIRFKKDDGGEYPEWEEKGFGEFLTSRVQKQVPSQEAPLMAFTATGGIESKGDKYDRSFLVKSDEKLYKRTELNDFIYSSNNLDVGSIGLNKYGTAVISDVYEIFIINKEVSYVFISELIKTPKVMSKIISYRQGVMYGQYRIHAENFLKIKEFIPCLEEQTKIANFLLNIDNIIEKEKEKLKALREWKKGLLQQMFV